MIVGSARSLSVCSRLQTATQSTQNAIMLAVHIDAGREKSDRAADDLVIARFAAANKIADQTVPSGAQPWLAPLPGRSY